MACFLVPATVAAVTTIAEHVVKGKEERANKEELTLSENSKTPFSHKLKWLNHMLWGGSALLAFEHIWHGEVTPWFPFLTAAGNPEDAMAMLHEMATTGVAMAVLVTAVWYKREDFFIMSAAQSIIAFGELKIKGSIMPKSEQTCQRRKNTAAIIILA